MRYFLPLAFLWIITSLSSVFAAPIVGGDKDAHGCIGSAGYSYSETLQKCIRPWELYSIDRESITTGNARLDTILKRKWDIITSSFQKDAELLIREISREFDYSGSSNYELQIHPVLIQTGSIISVAMETYTYLGGAHGSVVVYTWNYDTKKNKLLFLPTVLNRKELQMVAKNIEQYLVDTLWADADKEWIQEWLSPKKLSNYATFTVHTDKSGNIETITFYFADYQVWPHAIGMPVVTIDKKTLSVKK